MAADLFAGGENREAGFVLRERLAIYPEFSSRAGIRKRATPTVCSKAPGRGWICSRGG